jgi:hypothetical protein
MKVEQRVVLFFCFLIKEEVSMGYAKRLFWSQHADNYCEITVRHRSAETKCHLGDRQVSSFNEARNLLKSLQDRTN